MINKRYGITVTSIAIILVLFFFTKNFLGGSAEFDIPEEYAEQIIEYENGDRVYVPEETQITYDIDGGIFYDNELLVYTDADLSSGEKKRIAQSIDGVVVGEINGAIQMIQIAFAETDYQGLCEKAETLMQNDAVIYAGVDCPVMAEAADTYEFTYLDGNPWSPNKDEIITDIGEEGKPGGNDWWAEAIGAYTAWGYGQDADPVNVGIIDSGFDLDHEELSGRISMLEDFSENDEEILHGTSVAGIIGAADNDVGLRGIHAGANMICADKTPVEGTDIMKDEDGYHTTAVFAEIINQMVEKDVKVLNMSWALDAVYTLKVYLYYWPFVDELLYDDYLSVCRGTATQTAKQCIVIVSQLIKNDEDMLFVQAAGNGWNGGNDNGYEANKYTGFFASVTESSYKEPDLSLSVNKHKLLSYQEIKKHILVVGAVENQRDKDGNYRMTQWSNHGVSVDICAPGETIFSTSNSSSGQEYTFRFAGTSASAPMVTGSAALLWGIDPELKAEEVKELLLRSATKDAYGYYFKNMRYPMLNLRNAVREICAESPPPEPEEITDLAQWDDLLYEKLRVLVEKYGVVETGTIEFTNDEIEAAVISDKASGILGADVYDYDGDGKNELFVVRAKTYGTQGEAENPYTSEIYLSMYDEFKDGFVSSVELADEKVIKNPKLNVPLYSTSFHLARGTDAKECCIYFDYYFSINTQSFGTIRIEYDDKLSVVYGVECTEYATEAICETCDSDLALESILGQSDVGEGRPGWNAGKMYAHDWETDVEEFFAPYHKEYHEALSKLQLKDSESRSVMVPAVDKYGTANLYYLCSKKPVEHYSMKKGTLTELCGMISPNAQGGATFSCYDSTDMRTMLGL